MIEFNKRRTRERKPRTLRGQTIVDDNFSREFEEQGPEGKLFRMLYLRNPMVTYMKKVQDESLRY